MDVQIKRAYDAPSPDDGFRVYIDRLWPRGLSHETFHYDLWDKDIAPSTDLREWFHADPAGRWNEFAEKYEAELRANPAFAAFRGYLAGKPRVTLLYSSRDRLHNNAAILARILATAPFGSGQGVVR